MLPIAAYSFDADDTLWDFDSGFHPAIEHAVRLLDEALGVRHTGEELEAVRAEVARAMPGAGFAETRRAAFAETVRRGGGPAGLGDQVYESFTAVRAERTQLYPETRAVLEKLAGRVPLALTTNGVADLAWFGLDGVFSVITRAAEVGVHKPDPAIYRITAERLGLPPEQILHVGDHPVEDYAAAREAGLQAVLLDRTGEVPGSIASLADLVQQ